jgi:hypothetical protein
MTFSLRLAGLILLAPVLAAQDVLPTAGPHLVADPPKVDFGEAFEGETLIQGVKITNIGNLAWSLSRIQTSCGCTVTKLYGPDGAELPTRAKPGQPLVVIEVGQSIETSVEFKTEGKHGAVNQHMQLYNTDTTIPPLQVPVSVKVNRALSITPRWVNLQSISKTAHVEETVVLEALEIGDWKIAGFTSQIAGQTLPDYLSFEVLDETGPTRRIKLTIEGKLPHGTLSPRVRILIDHDRIDHVDFTITGIVKPDVTFDSGQTAFQENINFEQFGKDETVTKTLTITNKDPSIPYLLESIDLLTQHKEFFETKIVSRDEGNTYKIEITVDGKIGAPFFRGSLVLRAKHPDLPQKMIPFHGWVKQGS